MLPLTAPSRRASFQVVMRGSLGKVRGLVASAFYEVTYDTAAAARWLDWADLLGRTMRVLLTGASGFIGSALAAALQARGHAVVRVLRHPCGDGGDVVQADFAQPPGRAWWGPRLA